MIWVSCGLVNTTTRWTSNITGGIKCKVSKYGYEWYAQLICKNIIHIDYDLNGKREPQLLEASYRSSHGNNHKLNKGAWYVCDNTSSDIKRDFPTVSTFQTIHFKDSMPLEVLRSNFGRNLISHRLKVQAQWVKSDWPSQFFHCHLLLKLCSWLVLYCLKFQFPPSSRK